ncbi:uncharacterized protein LOC123308580 isoform X1 [Coccinella septempunctata]|uniref:uncharacterized protein LOC123308580 isoform X1 n=1 Tax=Coccinella septempunctata TaxID=41139 RepID=UPI001D06003A|nr:uncharacterized protein LOC123308580 isoform X1 [Coccinella septempunctata]
MYMSNRIGKIKPSRPPPRKRSLDDIDELTYMLMLGTKAGGRSSTSTIASIVKKMALTENKWLPETEDLPEHVEVHHRQTVVDEDLEEEESSTAESVEEPTSEVSIPDKIRCIKFANLEFFAEMFVDEIIDISVDVCENLFNAALSGEGGLVTEVPCICDATKPAPEKIKLGPSDNSSLSSVEKKEFSGWPTIKHFTVGEAKKKIMEFMGQWYFVEDWKYTVHYIGSYSDTISDYHLFQGMWSIPTKEYPIAQATATIFFSIEVSRVKPKFCLVDVTLQFEGSSSVYRAGQFEFIEQWLFNIIDSKLNLFRTLRF